MKKLTARLTIGVCVSAMSSAIFAGDNIAVAPSPCFHPSFYVAANVGVMEASFNSAYRDQTDLIPANMTAAFQQHAYTGGLAIGVSQIIKQKYFVGAEISGSYDSHSATYQAGSGALFSDNVQVNNHFDLTFVPGLMLSDTVAAYLKIGVSRASVLDMMTSPVGYLATTTRYSTNTNATGFVGGLGLEKLVTDHISVFVEGNYRDYGTVSFSGFDNFTASYTNSSHVYTYDAGVGRLIVFKEPTVFKVGWDECSEAQRAAI